MDELTEEEVASLRDALEKLERELETSIKQNDLDTRPVDLDQPIGRLSRMDAIQHQKMAEAVSRRLAQRFGHCQAAISRFERGDYGYCVSCDDPIALPRLMARPESPWCLSCKSKREQAGR
jgi:DnaK suppressor protein